MVPLVVAAHRVAMATSFPPWWSLFCIVLFAFVKCEIVCNQLMALEVCYHWSSYPILVVKFFDYIILVILHIVYVLCILYALSSWFWSDMFVDCVWSLIKPSKDYYLKYIHNRKVNKLIIGKLSNDLWPVLFAVSLHMSWLWIQSSSFV